MVLVDGASSGEDAANCEVDGASCRVGGASQTLFTVMR